MRRRLAMGLAFGIAAAVSGHHIAAQAPQLGFFITSAGPATAPTSVDSPAPTSFARRWPTPPAQAIVPWRAYLSAKPPASSRP